MNNNENLDSMAKRYKDEMMRLYRMNGGTGGMSPNMNAASEMPRNANTVPNNTAVPINNAPVNNAPNTQTTVQTTQRQVTTSGQCRFMSAEEIISSQTDGNAAGIPMPLPSYGPDVTDNLINGPVPTPYSLTGSGIVNADNPMPRQTEAAAPRTAAAPSNEAPAPETAENNDNAIRGVFINPMVTGTTVNTQLSGSDVLSELLPAFEFPPDLAEDEAMPASIDPRFVIIGSWTNLTGDTGWGSLQFEVTTGSQGNPVQGATVVVSRVINGKRLLTRILRTNASGLTRTVFLPAPKYVYNPYRPGNSRPFAEYTASVYANGYYPLTNINIMIEAGVKSLQPVDLIPYPESGTLPGIQPRS
ncbi:MAG: hypothetical protein ACI4XF_00170 [Oscillospiraceae bacterium]